MKKSKKVAQRARLSRAFKLLLEERKECSVILATEHEVQFQYGPYVATFKYEEGRIYAVCPVRLSEADYTALHDVAQQIMLSILAAYKRRNQRRAKKPKVEEPPQLKLFTPAQLPMHARRKK